MNLFRTIVDRNLSRDLERFALRSGKAPREGYVRPQTRRASQASLLRTGYTKFRSRPVAHTIFAPFPLLPAGARVCLHRTSLAKCPEINIRDFTLQQ